MNNAHFAERVPAIVPIKPAPSRPDPASRLPIPPMVRCSGCPDVPQCTHVARAEVGRCWRCQQEAARAARLAAERAGVAA